MARPMWKPPAPVRQIVPEIAGAQFVQRIAVEDMRPRGVEYLGVRRVIGRKAG